MNELEKTYEFSDMSNTDAETSSLLVSPPRLNLTLRTKPTNRLSQVDFKPVILIPVSSSSCTSIDEFLLISHFITLGNIRLKNFSVKILTHGGRIQAV